MEHATPDENGYLPTPYELGGRDELAAMLRKLGFEDTKEVRITEEGIATHPENSLTQS